MAKIATMKVWAVDLGLAVHVEAPNGRYIVIDLGSKNGVEPLKNLAQKSVGYMVITHPHHDHFSDIKNIDCAKPDVLWRVKSYTREELLDGVRDSEIDDFVNYWDFEEQYNGEVNHERSPASGIPFNGLTAKVFSTTKCDKSNKNNFSAIVVIQLGNAKVVVCGDNEKESFDELMTKKDFKESVANAFVLVAPHHGRDSGFHEKFVELVNPYITIISDTKRGPTSVTKKYEAYTKGYNVLNMSSGYFEKRLCLSTRKDGNIKVEFGESENPQYLGRLNVYSHC